MTKYISTWTGSLPNTSGVHVYLISPVGDRRLTGVQVITAMIPVYDKVERLLVLYHRDRPQRAWMSSGKIENVAKSLVDIPPPAGNVIGNHQYIAGHLPIYNELVEDGIELDGIFKKGSAFTVDNDVAHAIHSLTRWIQVENLWRGRANHVDVTVRCVQN